MARQHKHKGVLSNGKPKLHPVSQQHKDTYAKKCHQLEINLYNKQNKEPTQKSTVEKVKEIFSPKLENVSVDKDNYILVDLTKNNNQKGARIKFQRKEGRTKRTVGIQIEK